MSKVQVCFIVFICAWLCAFGLIVLVESDAIQGLPQPISRAIAACVAGLSVIGSLCLYLWSLRQPTTYSKDLLDDAINDDLMAQAARDYYEQRKQQSIQRLNAIRDALLNK